MKYFKLFIFLTLVLSFGVIGSISADNPKEDSIPFECTPKALYEFFEKSLNDRTLRRVFDDSAKQLTGCISSSLNIHSVADSALFMIGFGKYEDAVIFLNQTIAEPRYTPSLDSLLFLKGMALNLWGDELNPLSEKKTISQKYDSALQCFTDLIKLRTNHAKGWYHRALLLHNLERDEESITSLDSAIKYDPSLGDAWTKRGMALVSLGRYAEALETLDSAAQYDSEDPYLWDSRGSALHGLGRFRESVESYDKAISLNLNEGEMWYNRGLSLENLSEFEKALESFNKALEKKPNHFMAWNDRGLVLGELGRQQEALQSYDKAIEVAPDYISAWFNRGVLLSKMDRYQEGAESISKALELAPTDWPYRAIGITIRDEMIKLSQEK